MRKDRLSRDHGEVCIYIKEDIKYQLVENLTCCDDHEIIWVKLMLTRSPRGVSCVLLVVVYYPGRTSPVDSDGQTLLNHLFDSTTAAEAMFPSCGFIITGDFNRLNTGRLQNHFNLKQLVKFPTRGDAVLDLVLTNMSDHLSSPQCFPPFGLSDHCTVIVQPKRRESNQHTRKSITIRDIRVSKKICLGRYFSNIDWSIVTNRPTCEGKFKAFCELVDIGMSNIMPERTIKVCPKDVPWMSFRLKELIRLRQLSFHANKNSLAFKFYRNAVNKERKRCKANYYASKVQDLKDVNPRRWWSEVKRLCGSKNQEASLFSSLNVPEYNSMSATEVANSINDALLEPPQAYEPIESECEILRVPLEDNPEVLEVSAHRV